MQISTDAERWRCRLRYRHMALESGPKCALQVASLLAGYTLTMLAFYSLVPLVLQWSKAAVPKRLNSCLVVFDHWFWCALAVSFPAGRLHAGHVCILQPGAP